jgi:hypothetical protein
MIRASNPQLINEDELQQEIRDLIHRVQQHNFSIHRRGYRGTHGKTQGVVKGTLTVEPTLPEELAQGICSPENQSHDGGKRDVVLRFANERVSCKTTRLPAHEAAVSRSSMWLETLWIQRVRRHTRRT